MPKIQYKFKRFSRSTLEIIQAANHIIHEYMAEGYSLTLRQLYYQFVSRDLIANKQSEYKRLGSIINNARLAGKIDWHAIEDRTRSLQSMPCWETPEDIVKSAASQYRVDKWENQLYRPEVWIEKDALIGVISGVCQDLDIPYFSCRGYTSQSETWAAGQRLLRWIRCGQAPIIIHLGDHDPSGIDMTRDIQARLNLFTDYDVHVERIALNMNQVEKYDPPPNPAKLTDSRCNGYIKKYGRKSWELDALDPKTMTALIERTVERFRNPDAWDEAVKQEKEQRADIEYVVKNWQGIMEGRA